MVEGELTKEQLQAYAKDYYLHIKAFPKYLSAIHSRCDDLEARKLLLDNLMDEENGYPNHIDLWKQFVFALGVTPEELEAHEPSEAAKAKVATFVRWCTGDSLAAGVAALYSYESQIPRIAREKIRGLTEYFDFPILKTMHISQNMKKRMCGMLEKKKRSLRCFSKMTLIKC